MFTGIIETIGEVAAVEVEGTNYHFTIHASFQEPLYIDQSIAHNGVCLTVVKLLKEGYVVTAIKETLEVTNLGTWKVGDKVNLERSVSGATRMDGHIVQGHVDATTKVTGISDENGSWYFTFELDREHASLLVNKGSVTINGTSLTVVEPTDRQFKVAIIPYTYEHTNFHKLTKGDLVNLEFDVIGKYVKRYLDLTA